MKKLIVLVLVCCMVLAGTATSSLAAGTDLIGASPSTELDSSPLPLVRGTLYWSDQTINYNSRMRFISSYSGGYFTIDGTTATFTVSTTDGASETIEIDWCDSDGNATPLYSGTTSSKTVSYTASGRESGNFRVWNKSVAAITVDASISY